MGHLAKNVTRQFLHLLYISKILHSCLQSILHPAPLIKASANVQRIFNSHTVPTPLALNTCSSSPLHALASYYSHSHKKLATILT